ncbi:serine/threonine protein phosphatase PP2A-associated protein [Cristinia sonorae]|uniref:Serine/threonine protein phosphatase PP2A-associated protein n=1 Tax=Cristinia sonorae TaxID=1940300 RepID=A0A8K0UNT2_9AGAR|nr:serine/threonine protein phosphatase PP2A-associated protein [Cristinia sonorae]
MDVPLPVLFRRALESAGKASNLPTVQDQTQELIQSALSDLRVLSSRVNALSLFSSNESLEDIATKDLVYLFVPFVWAEVQNRARTVDRDERMDIIQRIRSLYRIFLTSLDTYHVVPETEKALFEQHAAPINDPAKRRELKIKQYKQEKELKTRIETVRKRRNGPTSSIPEPTSDFDHIASLLPSGTVGKPQDEDEDEEDSDTDDILREATLLLLRLLYAQSQAQLESLGQELQLLQSAPPPPPRQSSDDPRQAKARESDSMWKLDAPTPRGGPDGKGPLLDPSGKPLRPFTILPGGSTDRQRLQAQVFQPDHRLPTMTIDEYLEIENQRGNVISGGGPQSESQPTTSEQLALDSEMDGTAFGREREEAKRQKDENWARYTDENPKGAGNTMNRG